MTIYYVRPGTGSDSNGGTSWAADSWATLKKATDTVTAGGHTIVMSTAAADVLTTNTTYTLATGVKIVSSSDGTTYTSGAAISSTTFGVDIVFNGKGAVFGLSIAAATTGTSTLQFSSSDDDTLYFEDCIFSTPSTSSSSIIIGASSTTANVAVITRNCKFRFGNATAGIYFNCQWRSYGDAFCDSGTVVNTLFPLNSSLQSASDPILEGADLSALSSKTLLGDMSRQVVLTLVSCKLPASFTWMAGTGSLGHGEIYAYDCSYDNAGTLTGPMMYHVNYLGSTSVVAGTGVIPAAGPTYDGTNRCSWLVDGTANSNYNRHYTSPWLDQYNGDTSTSITPYLEIERDDSTTALTDEQVWVEFAYRGTANDPRYTYVRDRVAPLGTPANQGAGTGASYWTNESGTPWFGKLEAPSAFTPAEIGYMRARVCVGGDYSVYVDPQILGLA